MSFLVITSLIVNINAKILFLRSAKILQCWLETRKFCMIVALARKLAIALWRYLETGLIPEGAIVK